jgi:hypothetical protein
VEANALLDAGAAHPELPQGQDRDAETGFRCYPATAETVEK